MYKNISNIGKMECIEGIDNDNILFIIFFQNIP